MDTLDNHIESCAIDELNKPAAGMWLLQTDPEHCCIYRVPHSIRRVNPEAYTPQLVIIGPLHHSLISQALNSSGDITNTKSMGYLNMERLKKFYLTEFAQRLKFKGEQTIDGLRRIIEEEEGMIRASYSESTAWIESPQFIDMILHDSVFIIEFIFRICKNKKCNRFLPKNSHGKASHGKASHAEASHAEASNAKLIMGEPLMDVPCLYTTVVNDLILLENQLPYVILEKLSDGINSEGNTFRKSVMEVFLMEGKITDKSKFRHFTDLLRLVHVERLPQNFKDLDHKPFEHMHTASKLDSGGVEFEAVEEKFSLIVRFENGCLKIPCLEVENNVEMRLRNIMALEQCHYRYNLLVCNYVNFLDHLIDTHKDVELLVEKGIINTWIGEDGNVAEMVNKLCTGIVVYRSYYSDIANEANAYSSNWINRLCTRLKRVYFGDWWTGTATLAATSLLVMTLIQTVTSIIKN